MQFFWKHPAITGFVCLAFVQGRFDGYTIAPGA